MHVHVKKLAAEDLLFPEKLEAEAEVLQECVHVGPLLLQSLRRIQFRTSFRRRRRMVTMADPFRWR